MARPPPVHRDRQRDFERCRLTIDIYRFDETDTLNVSPIRGTTSSLERLRTLAESLCSSTVSAAIQGTRAATPRRLPVTEDIYPAQSFVFTQGRRRVIFIVVSDGGVKLLVLLRTARGCPGFFGAE